MNTTKMNDAREKIETMAHAKKFGPYQPNGRRIVEAAAHANRTIGLMSEGEATKEEATQALAEFESLIHTAPKGEAQDALTAYAKAAKYALAHPNETIAPSGPDTGITGQTDDDHDLSNE